MSELSVAGQKIYDSLTASRPLTAAHEAMVLNACRLADTLDRIELELALNPSLTVVNSQGTRTINPLISEARMLTGQLSQIFAKLGVSELPAPASGGKSWQQVMEDEVAKKRAERAG